MDNFGTNIRIMQEEKIVPPKSTKWQIEDHTLGKHRVLRNYMNAWLPIMRSKSGRVLIIDAFAGPGEYSGGEHGSPIIALKALLEHPAKDKMNGELYFLFIEKELARKEHLENAIKPYIDELPVNCYTSIFHATYCEKMTGILDWYDKRRQKLPPAFVMIDPFGISHNPMHVIRRIMAYPRTEVYVSFMYSYIDRFRGQPNFETHLDHLFGCPEWRDGIDMREGMQRKKFFYDLYEQGLRKAGANAVLNFELYKEESLIYTIFFATQHDKGCEVMKKAMWKTAPFGDFKFKGGRAHQLTLGEETVDLTPLREELHEEFGHQGWVDIQSVQDFVMTDRTVFHTGHLKTKTLVPMEEDGEIEADPGTRKSKKTYPIGTMLKFVRQ